MKSETIVVLIALALNVLLSMVVFLRNPKRLSNIMFAAFGGSIILWSLFNYLADNAINHNLQFTRLTVLFGSLIATSLAYLSINFPRRIAIHRTISMAVAASSIINVVLCLTDAYVSSVDVTSAGAQLQVGPLYGAFMIYMFSFVLLVLLNFKKQLAHAHHAIEKSQIKLFVLAFLVYGVFALASNVVLPLIIDNWSTSKYGPIFTVPFVGITAYAIIKHHLFDVRAVVARVLAYLVTLTIIIVMYSLLVVFIVARIVSLDHLSELQLFLLAMPTIVCTLTFPYIKEFVDGLTAQVFYQDIYRTRDVLEKLSNALISGDDVHRVTHDSLRILSTALHPTSLYTVILDNNGTVFKEYATNRSKPSNFETIVPLLSSLKNPVTSRDDHDDDKIGRQLTAAEADVVLRLRNGDKLIGFIFFGSKKNGGPYSTQDQTLLRVAANNLSVALDNAQKYEQISHFANTLKEEVDHATERLRHANEKLRTLDKLKDDFLSMASHQFRTPAGSIRQAFNMIRDPNLSKKDRDEVLRLAEANSEQLSSLVNTMLDISRIEAGRFSIERSLTDLPALVDKIILATDIVAEQKHIKLDFERPDHTILLEADRGKISEAMKNYVENAIKYSPDGSTVNIKLFQNENVVHFEVRDSGMGVPEPERKHLFGKFYRAQNARTFQPDGNGIGLYVVKNIVEGHGGEPYYEPLEQGSLFGFSLPLSVHHKHPISSE